MAEPAVAGEYGWQPCAGAPDAPPQRARSLWRLLESAHALTDACIVDYAARTHAEGVVVRRLRIAVMSLFVLGALTPALAGQMGAQRDGAGIGYVLWALAGGLALLDEVFGVSRTWTRDRRAQARLEASAVNLRYAWAARLAKSGGATSDPATAAGLADLILTHVEEIDRLAGAETRAWVEHVRTQLALFRPS